MYELQLEKILLAVTCDLPEGLLIVRADDDQINNIRLIFANKAADIYSHFPFQGFVGQTIQEMYGEPMEDRDFAQAWMQVATTGNPMKLRVEYKSDIHPYGVFDVLMYNVGDRCVATLYRNVTKEESLQKELDKVQNKLAGMLEAVNSSEEKKE